MNIKVGDRIKLDIQSIMRNGMHESIEMRERFDYILDHPENVYVVSSVDYPGALAPIKLDHPILSKTSFFEDELIVQDSSRMKGEIYDK